MDNVAERIQIGDWVLRVRQPEGPGPHPLIVMIHGWTGDENVMWIFAPRLPQDALIVAPRGMHPTSEGGYGWETSAEREQHRFGHVDSFRPAVHALRALITPENFPQADFDRLSLVGFSQGAAVTYTMGLLHPHWIQKLAGLAGFLPDGAEGLVAARPLQGKQVFHAHGVRDERVPVERARQAVGLLEQAGARVIYCEDDVGHKLSLNCFKALQAFFAGGL